MEILQTLTPHLVVLDIMMAPMDGWDILTAIRSTPATRNLPVTMYSGKPPAQEDIRLFGGWIDDYLMKPLDFDDMSGVLEDIIDRSNVLCNDLLALKQKGLNPLHIDEYSWLRKSLFIYRKFSEMFEDSILENETKIHSLEKKMDQQQNSRYNNSGPGFGNCDTG
jgi:two-component system, OmpR family, response regulator